MELFEKEKNCGNNNDKNMSNIKTRQTIFYKYTNAGPFELYLQGINRNISNYNFFKIAKYIHDLKLNQVKISKKGKNRISLTLSTMQAANEFLFNKKIKEDGYLVYTPSNNVTCRDVASLIDPSFSDEELQNYSASIQLTF